jgi:hypothetical protein
MAVNGARRTCGARITAKVLKWASAARIAAFATSFVIPRIVAHRVARMTETCPAPAILASPRKASAPMPYQIMYSSEAKVPLTAAGLEEILVDAREGNQARDVTGALVYVDGVFFQILEGDEGAVRKLMASIASDSRHQSVKVFYEAEVASRAFASWRMAYLAPTAQQMSAWAGLPAATTVGELLADVNRDPQRAPRILVNVLTALAK